MKQKQAKRRTMAIKIKPAGYVRKTIELMGRGYTLRHALKIAYVQEVGHDHKARG